jgi:aspartyl-tRNA(Asn)/glutamyl-tRNA(Gln) amidotransferase subunit B
MNTPYHIVIGLEVHVQLLTRTKLFCGCSTEFGLPPNSATCPVCCGLPGVLPVMNRRAFELAVRAATALNCEIAPFTKWDRKNYYYPDLPKNYQISQYDLPFSLAGHLEIDPAGTGERKRIGIIRVHLEEDAGKLLHEDGGSKVDLNRTGTPLLEIVSQPDLTQPEDARAYLEELRLLLRELEISDCEMQEGSLRCDANINLHIPHQDSFVATPIIEVKNLNSIRGVERALKYEAERQYQEFRSAFGAAWQAAGQARRFDRADRLVDRVVQRQGDRLVEVAKATAGWNDDSGKTLIQRRKEEAADYRYFPDPDLAPVVVEPAWLAEVRAGLGELPATQRQRLQAQYGLTGYDAEVISRQGRRFVAYFDEVVRQCGDAVEAKNWIANDLLQTLNERKLPIGAFPIPADRFAGFLREVKEIGLNKQRAREVYSAMLDGGTAREVIDRLGFKPVGDSSELLPIVQKAIAANPKAVADFKKGKLKAADAIKGAVMRETRGMARMEVVQQLVMEELARV